MIRKTMPLILVLILIISHGAQVTADEIPAVVRVALGRFVGEWNLEFVVNGATIT